MRFSSFLCLFWVFDFAKRHLFQIFIFVLDFSLFRQPGHPLFFPSQALKMAVVGAVEATGLVNCREIVSCRETVRAPRRHMEADQTSIAANLMGDGRLRAVMVPSSLSRGWVERCKSGQLSRRLLVT